MTDEQIHRTPALDKLGLARCRKDNRLFSWRNGGACKVCGVRVEEVPTDPKPAKPKRQRVQKSGSSLASSKK